MENINCLRVTYKLNVLLALIHTQRILPRRSEASPRRRGTLRFSSSSNLIRTYLNHFLRFLNYRCTNSGLIIQKHSIMGILGTHVPIHPEHVPVHVAFCWHVPVHVGHVPVHVGRGGKICPTRWASPVHPELGPGWAIKLLARKNPGQIWPSPIWPGPARPSRIFFCLEKTIWPDHPGF